MNASSLSRGAGLLSGLFVALAMVPASARAQTPVQGSVGVALQTFSFSVDAGGLESVTLFTVPLGLRTVVAEQVTIDVTSAFALGRLTRSGVTSSISGPTDTEVRLSTPLAGDALVFTALIALPTGKSELDAEELAVAGAVASDLLPFRLTNWGSGGGVGASVAFARDLGEIGLGVSAGYVRAGEYEAQPGQGLYRPGDMIRLNAVADRAVGSTGKASLRVSLQFYTDDTAQPQSGGEAQNFFQSGNRYEALGSYAFAAGRRSSGMAYVGYHHRQQGTYLVSSGTWPSHGLAILGGGLRMPLSRGHLMPSADLRVHRREDGLGQGVTASLGARADWPTGSVIVRPSARVHFGSVELTPNASSGFWGLEVGAGVVFGSVSR